MSPFPTVFTLRNVWVYVGTMDCSNVASNIEVLIDKTFDFGTTLNIPNIKLYDSYIQFKKDFDNSQPKYDNNVVENMVILDDFLDYIS